MAKRSSFGKIEERISTAKANSASRKKEKRYFASYVYPPARRGEKAQRHTPGRSFPSKADAQGWLNEERALIDSGEWTPPKERLAKKKLEAKTVGEQFEMYLERKNYPETTKDTYTSVYNNRIKAYLGDTALIDVNRDMVRHWWRRVCADFPNTKPRNKDAFSLLCSLFNAAVDEGLIPESPAKLADAVLPEENKDGENESKKKVLTVQQLQGIVKAMPEHYRVAVMVAGGCALRIGEWSALRFGDVTLHRHQGKIAGATITISRSVKERSNGEKFVGATKTRKVRSVAVPAHLAGLLAEHMDKMPSKDREALLFPNVNGEWTDRRRFNKALKKAGATVGRGDISSHDLRHYGGTEFARTGATLADIMARLGHSTVTSAMTYQHASAQRDADLAAMMPVVTLPTDEKEEKWISISRLFAESLRRPTAAPEGVHSALWCPARTGLCWLTETVESGSWLMTHPSRFTSCAVTSQAFSAGATTIPEMSRLPKTT